MNVRTVTERAASPNTATMAVASTFLRKSVLLAPNMLEANAP